MDDPRAVEPLIVTLDHENQSVREAVAMALMNLGRQSEAHEVMRNLELEWSSKIKSLMNDFTSPAGYGEMELIEIGTPAVKWLVKELGSGIHIRGRAAAALGVIGDMRAVEPLIDILEFMSNARLPGYDWGVRAQIVSALKSITGVSLESPDSWRQWWNRREQSGE